MLSVGMADARAVRPPRCSPGGHLSSHSGISGAMFPQAPAASSRRNVARVRSDGDTWDITTSAGSMALFAAAFVNFQRHARPSR